MTTLQATLPIPGAGGPPSAPALAAGFADPVHDAQRAFAALMRAMAEPGRPVPLASALQPPAPLSAEMAAAALALLDYETPVFLDPALADAADVARFVRFHTGAPVVADPAAARFALIRDGAALPDFAGFAQGEPDYPDRSATLLVEVARMSAGIPAADIPGTDIAGGASLLLEGPGIAGRRRFGAEPLPADFARRLTANRALYPLGIDLILCAPGLVAGLPRSVVARPGAPRSED